MSDDSLDNVPTGNNPKDPAEFPLPSLRKFLLPTQLVYVKSFEAESLTSLDEQINDWVRLTKNIIAIIGPVVSIPKKTEMGNSAASVTSYVTMEVEKYMITLSYVQSVEGNEDG